MGPEVSAKVSALIGKVTRENGRMIIRGAIAADESGETELSVSAPDFMRALHLWIIAAEAWEHGMGSPVASSDPNGTF